MRKSLRHSPIVSSEFVSDFGFRMSSSQIVAFGVETRTALRS